MIAPTRRRLLLAGLGAALATPLARLSASTGLREHRRSGDAFGTTVSMLVLHDDATRAEQALDAAFAEIRAVERAASLFDPDSDLSRLNKQGQIEAPNRRLVELLQLSANVSEITGGSFDITVQPYWPAWAAATALGASPSDSELAAARAFVDRSAIVIEPRIVRLVKPGVGITLNGIARGYACDRVVEILIGQGIAHALVDTDGFGSIGDSGERPWSVGIEHPRKPGTLLGTVAPLSGYLSTSGDYATTFSPDFQNNHIFTPTTGRSPTELASVTVVARSGALADALSTGIMVMGLQSGLELLRRLDGTEGVLVTKDGQLAATPGASFHPAG